MDGLTQHVGHAGVGGEFPASLRPRPGLHRLQQPSRQALATEGGIDVEAFQEGDGRLAAAVDIVVADRGFGEPERRAVRPQDDKGRVDLRRCELA